MASEIIDEPMNWVDPDILAYDEDHAVSYDFDKEREFKQFFETGWLDPSFDDLRDRWDPLLKNESPHTRVLAKTALWSVAQLRILRTSVMQTTDSTETRNDSSSLD